MIQGVAGAAVLQTLHTMQVGHRVHACGAAVLRHKLPGAQLGEQRHAVPRNVCSVWVEGLPDAGESGSRAFASRWMGR